MIYHRSSEKLLQNSGFSIRRTPFFFHQKCFLELTGILEGKKTKDNSFQKMHGSPWIHPVFPKATHMWNVFFNSEKYEINV
jgi:hypothetical protein